MENFGKLPVKRQNHRGELGKIERHILEIVVTFEAPGGIMGAKPKGRPFGLVGGPNKNFLSRTRRNRDEKVVSPAADPVPRHRHGAPGSQRGGAALTICNTGSASTGVLEINGYTEISRAAIIVGAGSSVTLTGLTYNTDASGLMPKGDAATVRVARSMRRGTAWAQTQATP